MKERPRDFFGEIPPKEKYNEPPPEELDEAMKDTHARKGMRRAQPAPSGAERKADKRVIRSLLRNTREQLKGKEKDA